MFVDLAVLWFHFFTEGTWHRESMPTYLTSHASKRQKLHLIQNSLPVSLKSVAPRPAGAIQPVNLQRMEIIRPHLCPADSDTEECGPAICV